MVLTNIIALSHKYHPHTSARTSLMTNTEMMLACYLVNAAVCLVRILIVETASQALILTL